jgi:eukaryotic-like serine/threonine-protein kinase
MSVDFEKLREVFQAAVEGQAPEQWDAYLDQACAGDEQLRRDVALLLKAHAEREGPLDRGAFGAGRASADAPEAEPPSREVGPYRLIQQLGEGGMGAVWMAQQTEPVKRLVALKLIKAGMDSRQVIACFEAERQALALMDHPNIAKVLDAGTTTAGRPYFVMELVKGVPITRYCDEHRLTPRERLGLFVDVCRAVQHAHQKGVIHRDLKPSNVLVALYDGEPVPKVIDFGVAKAAGQELTERTLVTGFGAVVGTLEYMSPEQAELNQLDIDTRSDIYSLGVLLYELLTGSPPLDRTRLREAALLEVLRLIREEEPPTPSARLSTTDELPAVAAQRGLEPRKLSGLLRGDLDWVVMKALAKDRNQRYATAKELADDVERFLDDRPVQARPPTFGDRLRKWGRRHRALVRSAAALAALAVAALAVGALLLRAKNDELARANAQEREARARADTNFDLAREGINEFLHKVTEDRDLQTRGDFTPLRKKLLGSAVPFLEKLVQQEPGSDRVEAQRAWAYGHLGLVHQQTGETEQALADVEQMRAILERLAHDHPDETAHRRDLAQAHTNRGALLRELHRPEEALAAYGQSQALWDGLAAGAPLNDAELAKNHVNRGNVLKDLGRRDEAVADYRAALAIFDQVVPGAPQYRREQAITWVNLANVLRELGRRDEALDLLSQATRAQEAAGAAGSDDPFAREDLAVTQTVRGNLLRDLGRREEALAAFREVRAGLARLAAEFPSVTRYRLRLAANFNDQVRLLAELRRYEEGLACSQEGLAVQEKLVADFPKVAPYRAQLATSHMNRGGILAELGRRDEELAAFRKALDLHEALAAEFPGAIDYGVNLGGSYCNMGGLLNELDRPAEALGWLEKALRTLDGVLAKDP